MRLGEFRETQLRRGIGGKRLPGIRCWVVDVRFERSSIVNGFVFGFSFGKFDMWIKVWISFGRGGVLVGKD